MPYSPYLTDTDRAIDRDANEMLSPRAGYGGAGYIAKGYANMDVLPEQMALADMLERRQRLSMNSRRGRADQADEDSKAADQAEFEGYSKSVRGIAGLPEAERTSKMRDMLFQNPNLANNPLVKEANTAMLAGDRAALDAKENVLRGKRADLEMRGVEYDDTHFDEKAKLQDMEFGNAREKARLTQKQIELANNEIESGDLSKAGENIFNMDALGPEHRESRDKLIKTIAQLSTDDTPDARAHIRALTDITGGIAMGNQVKQLKGYLVNENRDFLRQTLKSTGMDLSKLPADRAQRDAFIIAAHDAIQKKGGDLGAFGQYIEKAKGYNDSEEAVNTLTGDFLSSIEKLDVLRKSTDPKDQQEFKDELNLLRAKAAGQKGHIQREYANFENDQKIKEQNSKLAKEQADILERKRNGTNAEKRLANTKIAADFRANMAASKDQMERVKWAQKIVKEHTQDSLGLPGEATVDDVLNYAKTAAPPVEPGITSRDM